MCLDSRLPRSLRRPTLARCRVRDADSGQPAPWGDIAGIRKRPRTLGQVRIGRRRASGPSVRPRAVAARARTCAIEPIGSPSRVAEGAWPGKAARMDAGHRRWPERVPGTQRCARLAAAREPPCWLGSLPAGLGASLLPGAGRLGTAASRSTGGLRALSRCAPTHGAAAWSPGTSGGEAAPRISRGERGVRGECGE